MFKLIVFMFFSVCHGKISRLMGGARSPIEHTPSHVAIMFHQYPICGGAIIDERHVVTTASCVVHEEGVFYANLIVVAGVDDLDYINTVNLHPVSLVTYQENYLPRDMWVHDIAILTLEKSIIYTSKISPTPLLTNRLRTDTPGRISSFGQTFRTRQIHFSRYLKTLNIVAARYHRCFLLWKKFGPLHEFQSCILPLDNDSSVLTGDGGSGIYSQRRLLGVMSFTTSHTGNHAVYTTIPPYIDYIRDITERY